MERLFEVIFSNPVLSFQAGILLGMGIGGIISYVILVSQD